MINGYGNNETNAINVNLNVKSKNSETKTTFYYRWDIKNYSK